jgi:hypothetical protein
MAGELSITSADVHLVRATDNEIFTAPMGEAGTGGQYFRHNTTTGKLEKGNATSSTELGGLYGVLIDDAGVGMPGTIALPGAIIDLGDALSAAAYDAPIYASDTDATLATSAGTVTRVVGRVLAAFGATTADKLMRVM